METLSSFLAQNAIKAENIKFAPSARFLDKDKNPIQWEICCITSTEDEEIRKSCQKRVEVNSNRSDYRTETDYSLYLGRLASRCTVFPNLNDAELQNSYGVMGADTLLKTMLTPGEYAEYVTKVQQVNGFQVSFDKKVEQAKNL